MPYDRTEMYYVHSVPGNNDIPRTRNTLVCYDKIQINRVYKVYAIQYITEVQYIMINKATDTVCQ